MALTDQELLRQRLNQSVSSNGTNTNDPTTGTTQTEIATRLQFLSGDGTLGAIQPKPAGETASVALTANSNRIGFTLTSLESISSDPSKRILVAFGATATTAAYTRILYPGWTITADTLAEAKAQISVITELGVGTINYTVQEILAS